MYSVERLRALDAVHRLGSVARAAAELHVTPSGVSQQLARLERESGHRLTTPQGRGLRLTQAGLVLAAHATRVLRELAAARADLADLHAEILGPVRIGSVESAIRVLVAPALAALGARHPRLSPLLHAGEAVATMPRLHAGDLDVVVAESWNHWPTSFPADVSHTRLLDEHASVAVSTRHPLAGREVVDLAELGGTPWTACTPGTGAHDSLVQALRTVGVEPDVTCIAAEYPTQLALVRADVAAALVPPLGLAEPLDGIALIPTRPVVSREIVAAWRTSGDRPATRACVDALREVAAARQDAAGGASA